jgi:prepilin-type N-terminal cleavage/methylation domain-containing protein
MKKIRGFTLLETLVTLAVLGVFVVLSINFSRSSVQRASFNVAFNQFVADFYYTRQLAARENRYAGIIFNINGTSYDIVIQREIQTPPTTADPSTYVIKKSVSPLDGEVFFDGTTATNFALNSTGLVRAIPVNPDAAPIQFSLDFFKKYKDEIAFKRTIRIYPSGGIKIEKIKR